MSSEATAWAWEQPLDGRKKLLLLAIAHEANRSGACSVGQEHLADRCSGPNDEAIPAVVVIYAAIAAIAGSLGGLELALLLHEPFPVWIGTLAGLLSSILMALLMITYHSA